MIPNPAPLSPGDGGDQPVLGHIRAAFSLTSNPALGRQGEWDVCAGQRLFLFCLFKWCQNLHTIRFAILTILSVH